MEWVAGSKRRFMTISYFTGACTGSSAGGSPRRCVEVGRCAPPARRGQVETGSRAMHRSSILVLSIAGAAMISISVLS